jgi:hypothetical protein
MTTGFDFGFAKLGAGGAAWARATFRVEASHAERRCIHGHCCSASAVSVNEGAAVVVTGAGPVIATMLKAPSPESGSKS